MVLSAAAGILLAASGAAIARAAAAPPPAGAPAAQDAVRRAEALRAAGKTEEAVAFLRDAAAREPRSPQVQFALGSLLLRTRDFDGAIAALQAGLATAPHSLVARRMLAGAQRRKGDLPAARATLEGLWRDAPSFRPAGVDLAEVMAAQGDRGEAIQTYRYLIDTFGGAEDARLAALYAGLGKVLEADGDRAGAAAAYREALRINPKHAPARAAAKRLSR